MHSPLLMAEQMFMFVSILKCFLKMVFTKSCLRETISKVSVFVHDFPLKLAKNMQVRWRLFHSEMFYAEPFTSWAFSIQQ